MTQEPWQVLPADAEGVGGARARGRHPVLAAEGQGDGQGGVQDPRGLPGPARHPQAPVPRRGVRGAAALHHCCQ